jgi:hypothetical protein
MRIGKHALSIRKIIGYIRIVPMTPRCIAKRRPIKQRANLFAGD